MKRVEIEMPEPAFYTGEEFECEKTGIKLCKFTPIEKYKNRYDCQYSLFDGNRNYDLQEGVFNIIKNLMI